MTRKLRYDIPGPDWRRDQETIVDGGWEAVFAPELEPPLHVVVEIGFGQGEFLMGIAEKSPERAFVGVEISFKRVLKMTRRIAPRPQQNLRLVHTGGEQFVRLIPPASVQELWINFPDPWPKKRQAKHRLIQPAFVKALAEGLVSGGVLHVATDSRPYAEEIDRVLDSEPRLVNLYWPHYWRPDVEGRAVTAYEREWRAEGRPLHFFAYRRQERRD